MGNNWIILKTRLQKVQVSQTLLTWLIWYLIQATITQLSELVFYFILFSLNLCLSFQLRTLSKYF